MEIKRYQKRLSKIGLSIVRCEKCTGKTIRRSKKNPPRGLFPEYGTATQSPSDKFSYQEFTETATQSVLNFLVIGINPAGVKENESRAYSKSGENSSYLDQINTWYSATRKIRHYKVVRDLILSTIQKQTGKALPYTILWSELAYCEWSGKPNWREKYEVFRNCLAQHFDSVFSYFCEITKKRFCVIALGTEATKYCNLGIRDYPVIEFPHPAARGLTISRNQKEALKTEIDYLLRRR